MVRINLVHPKKLADQHLIAEYNEILMLLGYVAKHPRIKIIKGKSEIPEQYTLGKGHIRFFKDKLKYIKNRHETIKKEMKKRGFKTDRTITLMLYPKSLHNDWEPKQEDYKIIQERIAWKINKKPRYYRYYGKHKDKDFFIRLIKSKTI
jgi:deoxyribonuclease (pyrimidine dimer)